MEACGRSHVELTEKCEVPEASAHSPGGVGPGPSPLLWRSQPVLGGNGCWGSGREAAEMSITWAGYSVKCEYSAHKEGVLKEEMLLACEGGTGTCVRVVVQARVMGESVRRGSGWRREAPIWPQGVSPPPCIGERDPCPRPFPAPSWVPFSPRP